MELKYLDKYKSAAAKCVRCGGCQAACPTYAETSDESMVARGRMALVEAVIDGRLGITEGFATRINSCLDCKSCMAACPSDVKVDELIYAAKAEIAHHRGCNPMDRIMAAILSKSHEYPKLLKTTELLKKVFFDLLPNASPLPSFLKSEGKKRLLPGLNKAPFRKAYKNGPLLNPKGKVAFYVGCATNLVHQHIAEAVVEVLKHNNIDVIVSEDEQCCGVPFLGMGDRDTALEMANKNIELFTSMDIDAIITCCATCGATLKDYPKWVDGEGAKKLADMAMDVHVYLSKHTDYKKGLGPIDKSVTWHDPCHLSRGQGVKDEPREILQSIPGLVFKGMKKPCYCCGFGGNVSISDYDMSMNIAKRKVDSIRDSKADEVATGCPACKIHIEDALNHNDLPKKVRHPVEYLAEAYRAGK